MKKLVFIENDQALTTSLKVAEVFEKNHRHVLDSIRDIIRQAGGMPKIGQTPMFQASTYIHEQNGQSYPMYFINRDGFTLLAMGFTGQKALKFKLAYIDAFNRMEVKLQELLAQGKDARYFETRAAGKISRKAETSVIKQFIAYARLQGCDWEDSYFYSRLSILCNEGAGLPQRGGRDNATIQQLNTLDLMEGQIVRNVLINGMSEGLPYPQVMARMEQQINTFLEVTFQTVPKIAQTRR